jgi:predicted nucleotidyltransferase component of viral defense system
MLNDLQIQRKRLMEAISKEITQNEPEVVLKGGTALLLAYKLDRFSEDMDFDVPRGGNTDFEKHIRKAAKSICFDDIDINIKKDTDTTKRFMLHYGAYRDNDPTKDYPLKIEVSLRNQDVEKQETRFS